MLYCRNGMDTNDENATEEGRWTLIRDVAVFQVKLLVDGFRDLLLVPVSLITGFFSLINYRQQRGAEFYELLSVGRRSEHWINLFGAASPADEAGNVPQGPVPTDLDEVVAKVESFLVDEYRKGGVTAQAKKRLDSALDSISKLAERSRHRKGESRDDAGNS